MSGVEKLDFADASVQALLSAFATEMLSPNFDLTTVDSASFDWLEKIYVHKLSAQKAAKGEAVRNFAEQPEISALVSALEVHQKTLKQLPQARVESRKQKTAAGSRSSDAKAAPAGSAQKMKQQQQQKKQSSKRKATGSKSNFSNKDTEQ